VKAFPDIEVHFIIDKPTFELVDLVKACSLKHTAEILRTLDWDSGNRDSYYRQLDLATEVDDKVFFVEDDYYFLPTAGQMVGVLDEFDFVTPYEHPEMINRGQETAKDGWFSIPSTTLTFATHGKLVKMNIELMKKYGWADEPMWKELTKKYTLVQPTPSLATHMESAWLSPSISWQKYF
jgi:hypothetical protein